ncbi:MAG: Glucose-6-phosphate 1-dehydrogenase 2 [Nitrospirae bacterium]|nr:MAG: glucose-6-phosphate dehydrogenase [Nitrospira sp. OLB3]MBV6469190.1 Glucose-6-phosphate 1-dehydrogenase 2 [Nitrospirota bacterium]MCK6492594.1 glucose-6-phosphate dehydrogenase [Nitrospira sp.]MCK6499091.1 glucose-6-phosphate dehydrogenase [Nitrospira sp.]MEB2337736.1 glucose-6-phosphate dehydrogenase [Nitrospirales bacterium]
MPSPTSPIEIKPLPESAPPVEGCTLIIFGGSGDLARRRLIPALYNLLLDGLLPKQYAVIGLGRKTMTDDEFRDLAREGVVKHSRQALAPETWQEFERHLFYIPGENEDAQTYRALRSRAEQIERTLQLPGNRIFYLSIPPSSFASVCEGLAQAGLAQRSATNATPYARIIVEKPVGRDLASAQEINEVTGKVFDESQIFRIDHYLGKETVQNLMVVRFANSIFEPIWNHKYIDHVQITVSEAEGVGTRASYYEEAGALRDMIQNHLLQLLCLVAMEPPYSLDPNVVRNAKMEVLRCLRPIVGKDVEQVTVRAQYAEGTAHGQAVPGYRREKGVTPNSTTETYVAVKAYVENWRWSGVPFYLRTGKALPKRASEVAVQFRDIPQILFNANPTEPQPANVLTLRIQPDEGLSLRIVSRVPGTRAQTHPVEMDFQYSDVFGRPSPEAYERLLLDVMAGDASRFMRRDAVEASWAWVTKILEGWAQQKARWLPEYPAGTWGPVEAERLIQNDGRSWRIL